MSTQFRRFTNAATLALLVVVGLATGPADAARTQNRLNRLEQQLDKLQQALTAYEQANGSSPALTALQQQAALMQQQLTALQNANGQNTNSQTAAAMNHLCRQQQSQQRTLQSMVNSLQQNGRLTASQLRTLAQAQAQTQLGSATRQRGTSTLRRRR
jgi:hypothetical protein